MSAAAWLSLGLLGGVGAVSRYVIESAFQSTASSRFPLGTLVVNLLGSLLLGILWGAEVGTTLMFVLGAGLLGSFTTFSAWMLETDQAFRHGNRRIGTANLVVSIVAGLCVAVLGWFLGSSLS